MLATDTKEKILLILFIVVLVASGADLLADFSHGADTGHIIKEAVVTTFSIIAIVMLLLGLYQQKQEIKLLQQELATISTIPVQKKYVLEARKKLGNVVTQQFIEWKLTNSEIEIGWLLLKGLSLREISMIRNTKERTVRQQASTIYQKANISGRHSFSAWFIEDIL